MLTTVQMMVNVHDVEAHYAHAVEQGANITMELEDAFYGERRYEATDLEGHRWHFAESFDAIRARGGNAPEERLRATSPCSAARGARGTRASLPWRRGCG